MLNLTADRITLLVPDNAHESLTRTYEPSGFIARVEYKRREVGRHGFPYRKQIEAGTATLPIIEAVPSAIMTTTPGNADVALGRHAFESEDLLLVSREVAEAAATLSHPLASRMVWVDSPARELNGAPGSALEVIGYRELQRSANVREREGVTR
jgi:hypothetical protein